MNILLATDNNYVMPTGVLMHSIAINNLVDICYHVLISENFTIDNKKALQNVAEKYNNKISFYNIPSDYTKFMPIDRDEMPKHVSIACYYRLFLADILPDNVHKIIYFDGDIIVRKSLSDLWSIDLTNVAIACVHDQDEKKHIESGRHKYPIGEYGYFNSGMLVVNLDYWRKTDCQKRFSEYVQNHDDNIVMHDQDVLNAVLYNEKIWISPTYNFQVGFINEGDKRCYVDELYEEIGEVMQNPTVIHYCMYEKPWHLYFYNPYVRVWRYYKSLSQWKNKRLEGDNPDTLIHHVTMFLFRHGLMVRRTGRLRVILNK